MPKQPTKLKLSSLNRPASRPVDGTHSAGPPKSGAADIPPQTPRSLLLPGGFLLWCLIGLAIGLSAWLGGRTYLKQALTAQLSGASTEEVALQSIDALLRLDANATIEVSRGLAHPEFMVANAAFRALGGQLDAWTKLEPADRLMRMQQVVTELERIPEDIDQDHRILVSGLASRIYADTLSNREDGANGVLEACRRILARTDPNHLAAQPGANRLGYEPAASTQNFQPTPLPSSADETSPVPPPLAPLTAPVESRPITYAPESIKLSDRVESESPKRSMSRMSLSDAPEDSSAHMHLTAGANSLPQATSQDGLGRPSYGLSPSASSRSRIIPQDVEPLPDASSQAEPPATLGGIDELPIDQLVRLLASVQPRVSQAADLALRARGMSDENLELAIGLATGSAKDRQELLGQLVARDDLDARPWLLWMAADGEDQVRQYAIGLLMPLANDYDVRRQLRLLLNKERDEKVAQTIRRVLAK